MSYVLISECTPLLQCNGASEDNGRHTAVHIAAKEPPYPRKDAYDVILCGDDFMSDGLLLHELLPYAIDPWWQKLRLSIFYTLCLIWLLAFVTAIVLAYLHHDGCRLAVSAYGVLPTTVQSGVVLLAGSTVTGTSTLVSP